MLGPAPRSAERTHLARDYFLIKYYRVQQVEVLQAPKAARLVERRRH